MKKHGFRTREKRSKEYTAWVNMKDRCYNPNHKRYSDYGGRGITVCERWRSDFNAFLSDMGFAPSSKHSLDRYPDNDGNYEKNNCRWATIKEQSYNKRLIKPIYGKSAGYWSAECGGSRSLVLVRVRGGWSLDKAINTPKLKSKPKKTGDEERTKS